MVGDVPIKFPGYRNAPAPDFALLDDGAEKSATGRYVFLDLDIVVEIVSPSSVRNDYEIRRLKYAGAGVPTYLIIGPIKGRRTRLSEPDDVDYREESVTPFGEPVELSRRDGTAFRLQTDRFPQS
jgi:Uma2 family endonuclease